MGIRFVCGMCCHLVRQRVETPRGVFYEAGFFAARWSATSGDQESCGSKAPLSRRPVVVLKASSFSFPQIPPAPSLERVLPQKLPVMPRPVVGAPSVERVLPQKLPVMPQPAAPAPLPAPDPSMAILAKALEQEGVVCLIEAAHPETLFLSHDLATGLGIKKVLLSDAHHGATPNRFELTVLADPFQSDQLGIKQGVHSVFLILDNLGKDVSCNPARYHLVQDLLGRGLSVYVAFPTLFPYAETLDQMVRVVDLTEQKNGMSKCAKMLVRAIPIYNTKELTPLDTPWNTLLHRLRSHRAIRPPKP